MHFYRRQGRVSRHNFAVQITCGVNAHTILFFCPKKGFMLLNDFFYNCFDNYSCLAENRGFNVTTYPRQNCNTKQKCNKSDIILCAITVKM